VAGRADTADVVDDDGLPIPPKLFARLTAPRCMSLNVNGKPCRRRVPREGMRCRACWEALSSPGAPRSTRLALCDEPVLPRIVLLRLLHGRDARTVEKAIGRPDITADDLRRAAMSYNQAVRMAVVWAQKTDEELLKQMAGDTDESVRSAAERRLASMAAGG
jgi:hypothetical protein